MEVVTARLSESLDKASIDALASRCPSSITSSTRCSTHTSSASMFSASSSAPGRCRASRARSRTG
eukprot:3583070-Prymnesium_polylepis.1